MWSLFSHVMKNMQLDGLAIAIPEYFRQLDLIDPKKQRISGIHYCQDGGKREYAMMAKIYNIIYVYLISLYARIAPEFVAIDDEFYRMFQKVFNVLFEDDADMTNVAASRL